MLRRRLLQMAPTSIAVAIGAPTLAVARGPGAVPLRLGVDRSLAASGLAASVQRAFAAATGIALKIVAAPALSVLDAVRDGEVDAAIANAPGAEAALEKQSLVVERRLIAIGEFVVVGPSARAARRSAAGAGPSRLTADALLGRVRALAESAPAGEPVVFMTPDDGSGAHLVEQALWRSAGIAPKAPWYVAAARDAPFASQVRRSSAWAVVERGEWLAGGGPPLVVQSEGGAMLAEPVHVMRSFRAAHPAGKLFSSWIGDGRGRSVMARVRGYRAAA